MIDKILIDKLCCPYSGASLIVSGEFLVSTDANTRYRYKIEEGIPIMLKENCEILSEQEWDNIMKKNRVNEAQ